MGDDLKIELFRFVFAGVDLFNLFNAVFGIADVVVDEGNAGMDSMRFDVAIDGPISHGLEPSFGR